MKILAPVNTLESAVALIEAGSEEIYLGADDKLFEVFSFTGRGKISNDTDKVMCDFKTLKEITEYAHSKGVKVNFLGNGSYFHNGIYKNKTMEKHFLNYIEKGMDANVDSLVIGDLGLLSMIHDYKYEIELHASVYFRTINLQQIMFLKELGVKRTTLSYHITLDEIKELCKSNLMEFEVIGYLGCSFFNGACSFLHSYGEGVLDGFNPGVSCKGVYNITDGDQCRCEKIFDVESVCSICKLKELEDAGVEALKIVGRDRNLDQRKAVISIYKKALEEYRNGYLREEVMLNIPKWWKKIMCSQKVCKYNCSNPNYRYVIGG